MTAALLCEQRELVARLNDLANCIEEDKNPASKARSKVLYSKEREQYVQLLRKVKPSPHSFASACLEQPSPLNVGTYQPTYRPPSPLQIVASVQVACETDAATEKIAPATNHKILYRIGAEPHRARSAEKRPWDDERGAQRHDEGDQGQKKKHDQGQGEVATVSRDQKTTKSALDVKRMQSELETVFMERLDQGFVRIAEPAPHEARQAELSTAFMAWSALAAHSYVERRVRSVECRANAEPQPALHVRVRSEPTAAQYAEPTAGATWGRADRREGGARAQAASARDACQSINGSKGSSRDPPQEDSPHVHLNARSVWTHKSAEWE